VTRTALKLDLSAVPRHAHNVVSGRSTPDGPEGTAAARSGLISTRAIAAGGAAAIAAFATLIFFFHLGTYGLWEPDEGRYAEIAREMLATGNFVVPHLNYVPYIEKPPLLYWLTALSMWLFGVNEFAARFVNAAAALGGVLATYCFTLRAFDYRRAILAAVVLATSALYAEMAQVLTTDMLLTATLTVALFAFFLHWRDGGAWCWLFYSAMGLAMLTKGPVGAVIPLLAGAVFLWREGELRGAMRRFRVIPGMMLAAAISVPWFAAITFRERGFFDFYFVGEHFRRFFESSYSHSEPIYYYVPVIAAALLPWTIIVPFLPWRFLEPNPARRFCTIAAATIFVLFSLASAKLIPYILPAMPPLAIIIADAILVFADACLGRSHRDSAPDPRRLAVIGPILGILGAGVIAVAFNADRFASSYMLIARPALYAGGAVVIVGGILCFAAFWQRWPMAGLTVFVATATATLLIASYGRIMAEPTRSYAALARTIEQRAPDAVLVCYTRYIQSLPFYCRRRVILIGAKTELAYGAEHSPDGSKFFFTRAADLYRLWNEPQPTVLVLDRSALAPIEKNLGAFKVIASDLKKLAIMRADSDNSRSAQQ
jgi:4-amino-4-deoxy-L-arabinose transferase-like glycosyltransferase